MSGLEIFLIILFSTPGLALLVYLLDKIEDYKKLKQRVLQLEADVENIEIEIGLVDEKTELDKLNKSPKQYKKPRKV